MTGIVSEDLKIPNSCVGLSELIIPFNFFDWHSDDGKTICYS